MNASVGASCPSEAFTRKDSSVRYVDEAPSKVDPTPMVIRIFGISKLESRMPFAELATSGRESLAGGERRI